MMSRDNSAIAYCAQMLIQEAAITHSTAQLSVRRRNLGFIHTYPAITHLNYVSMHDL